MELDYTRQCTISLFTKSRANLLVFESQPEEECDAKSALLTPMWILEPGRQATEFAATSSIEARPRDIHTKSDRRRCQRHSGMPVCRLCGIPGRIHFRRTCRHRAYAGGDCEAPGRDGDFRGDGGIRQSDRHN